MDQEYLLKESNALTQSQSSTDHVIQMAFDTRSDLHSQRESLLSSNRRLSILNFPFISKIITRIGRRRRRDNIILGLVIAFLLFLLIVHVVG